MTAEWVRVDSDHGRAFEYWHIRPRVRVGQHVEARKTVLGRIMKPAGHVHLTEYENGRVYYDLDGTDLKVLPKRRDARPSIAALEWHASNVFR